MSQLGRTHQILGRYLLFEEIAAGGMATIHLGRLVGQVGFARTVAIKRLHPQYAKDPEFAAMFQDEARLASRIQHPNVVAMLDIVAEQKELFLVMDYVHGEPLSRLRRASAKQGRMIPPSVVATVMVQALHGLHAAHEAKGFDGFPLGIVHRDVSPQNVLVGTDGNTRITDFGIAKALGRAHTTRDGSVKGKLAYMSPEQLAGNVDRRTDVFAAAIVLWELLVGQSLFGADSEGQVIHNLTTKEVLSPTALVPNTPQVLSNIVLKGLARNPEDRFQTARDMAMALEMSTTLATATQVGAWVESLEGDSLGKRAEWVRELESSSFVPGGRAPTISRDPNDLSTLANSVSSPDRGPARRSGPIGIAIAALLAIGAGAGVAVISRRTQTPVSIATSTSDQSLDLTTSSEPAPPSTAVEAIPAPQRSSASVTTSAQTTAAPEIAPKPIKPTATVQSTAATATAQKQITPPANCNPPYTLGPSGKKMWKKECFP